MTKTAPKALNMLTVSNKLLLLYACIRSLNLFRKLGTGFSLKCAQNTPVAVTDRKTEIETWFVSPLRSVEREDI